MKEIRMNSKELHSLKVFTTYDEYRDSYNYYTIFNCKGNIDSPCHRWCDKCGYLKCECAGPADYKQHADCFATAYFDNDCTSPNVYDFDYIENQFFYIRIWFDKIIHWEEI